MPEYKVGLRVTVYAYAYVDAESEDEAMENARADFCPNSMDIQNYDEPEAVECEEC